MHTKLSPVKQKVREENIGNKGHLIDAPSRNQQDRRENKAEYSISRSKWKNRRRHSSNSSIGDFLNMQSNTSSLPKKKTEGGVGRWDGKKREAEQNSQLIVKCVTVTNLRWDRDSSLSTLLERLSFRLRLWLRLRLRLDRTEDTSVQLSPLTPPTETCCFTSPTFLLRSEKPNDWLAVTRNIKMSQEFTNGREKASLLSKQRPRSCHCHSYCIHRPLGEAPLKEEKRKVEEKTTLNECHLIKHSELDVQRELFLLFVLGIWLKNRHRERCTDNVNDWKWKGNEENELIHGRRLDTMREIEQQGQAFVNILHMVLPCRLAPREPSKNNK